MAPTEIGSKGSETKRRGLPAGVAAGPGGLFNDTGGYGSISTDDDAVDDEDDTEDVGGPDLGENQEVEFEVESS